MRIPSVPPIINPLVEGDDRPRWSVMIPVYNCFDYIEAAITSVLVQDAGNDQMQIEVIDDCSTDGDVFALLQKIGKGRVSYFKQPVNKGSLRNFETCINRSRGHYVHILHGDDFVLPGYYKEIDSLFALHPEAGAAFTNFEFCDFKGKRLEIINRPLLRVKGIIPDFLYKIAGRQLIQPPSIVVKRSTYENLGSFYAVHFGEDWEMWSRIAANYPVAYSPVYLASYRVGHGIGISQNSFLSGQNLKDITTVIDIIQTYLPANKRKRLKRIASSYYSIYSIRIANGLLETNRKAAVMQVSGALQMSRSLSTLLWALRFYIMYLIRYKEIARKSSSAKKNILKNLGAKKSRAKIELINKNVKDVKSH